MFKWLGGLLDSNEKELRRLQPLIDRINALEPEFVKLTDAELRAKTDEFKARLEGDGSLDELLPEAFAAVREASKRTVGLRHFDVQLMGGIILHQGKVAEMKTGEGKTLVATLPLYLNSLTGLGCHLVTVNDYLSRRDPYWMGPIYHALGVSVASIYPQQTPDERSPTRLYDSDFDSGDEPWQHFRSISRREAYEADITYGTSSEFGFDYLRDNMVIELSQCVQRPLNYAIVDEVDNLLIDEARTPLIISGAREESPREYQVLARIAPRLQRDHDYIMSEKGPSVDNITEVGYETVERMLEREGVLRSGHLYDADNATLLHHLRNAIVAKESYKRDHQYVVKDGEVIIVDEFTGRLMFGRRYSEGLHQAIEAKEGVKIKRESRTLATVTIQNYFRMYGKLAGMTGTALTEAEELHKIYNLEVVVIPTNEPMIREDYPDRIYKDEKTKFRAVLREIEKLHKEGRPVLVGTVSIEKSEYLSDLLKKKGISHNVLNAKYHEKEAGIIAQAGQRGAVTIATNMAGRGVDIILGGSPEGKEGKEWQKDHNKVIELGGLHIIGTERHEARRIDNQLRGRAGRQGDPGASRFYVSLEDDIIKRFGGERIKGLMEWAGMDEDTPIENKWINRSIESTQVRVEGYHFDMRKHLVEYDDVVNEQRGIIYGERRKIIGGADLKANILSMVKEELHDKITTHIPDEHGVDWDLEGLINSVSTVFPLPPALTADNLSLMKPEQVEDKLSERAEAFYEEREEELGSENMRVLERLIMLRTIDNLWVDYLTDMESMRLEAAWQTLRQVRSVDAYKSIGYEKFQELMYKIRHDIAHTIFHASIVRREATRAMSHVTPMTERATNAREDNVSRRRKVGGKKIGRNDPCLCGSGKKYKHCCGR